jgi:hypothetical protein
VIGDRSGRGGMEKGEMEMSRKARVILLGAYR